MIITNNIEGVMSEYFTPCFVAPIENLGCKFKGANCIEDSELGICTTTLSFESNNFDPNEIEEILLEAWDSDNDNPKPTFTANHDTLYIIVIGLI